MIDIMLSMSSNFNINNVGDVFAYCRVSTWKQYNQNDNYTCGIDNQYEACQRYSNNTLHSNINYYHHDVGSSYNGKNILKELNKLTKLINNNDVILVHDVSRLGRNIEQVFKLLLAVKRKGCYIISVTDNVCYGKTRLMDKKFWYKIIAAEEDSDKKSERMTLRIAKIRAKGGHIGIVPYGYTLQKMNGVPRLVKSEEEQAIMKIIKSDRQKNISPQRTADKLNVNSTRKGKQWTRYNVLSVDVNAKHKHYKLNKKSIETSMDEMKI